MKNAGLLNIYKPTHICNKIAHFSKFLDFTASSLPYIGGVLQFLKKRILSDQYMQKNDANPKIYRAGMAVE